KLCTLTLGNSTFGNVIKVLSEFYESSRACVFLQSSGIYFERSAYKISVRFCTAKSLKYVFLLRWRCQGYLSVEDAYGVDSVIVRVHEILPRKVEWSEKKIFRKGEKNLGEEEGLIGVTFDKILHCFSTDTDHAKAVPSAAMAVFFHRCSGREKPVCGPCPIRAENRCDCRRGNDTGKQ
ncbi:hypothetical protein TNCV_1626171, partial [Trichonephila clavipes]